MPPALDRLLASPSALRVLRSIVNAPELPAACPAATTCCHSIASRRNYSADRRETPKRKWRRWHDMSEKISNRERVRLLLEDHNPDGARGPKLDILNEDTLGIQGEKWDHASWAATLAHQERLKRLQGIRTIWKACRYRDYRLPTHETPDADFLWGTFIKNPRLVNQVIDHAANLLQETGETYPRLYHLIMGYWLPRGTTEALEYHHQMLVKLNLRKLPLRDLARLGRSTFNPTAYEALMDIYRNSNERDLYDDIVPTLIEKGNITMARRWHNLCIFRNDMPSDSVQMHPVVQILTAETSTISTPELHFEKGSSTKTPGKDTRRYNQELMRRLLGRDTAPVRFEDSFCARMFATRTFLPAAIIQGLAMVGVNEIGPQAVLAMALRTQPVEELPRRFEELKTVGIALQGCVFSLALEKFAIEQKWQLVRSLLDSDQHPDVFGDAEVQRTLLDFYLDQGDFMQVQRTLAILTLFHNDSSQESWNLLLQVYIKRSGPQHVMEVLQDMRTRGVMLSRESIIAIKSLLRRRTSGHKPDVSTRGKFDDLRFVTRVYMSILESGMGAISPSIWHEIIRRFGMLGRFRELRRLLLWLLCWYAPRSSIQFASLPESPFLQSSLAKLRAAHPERNRYFNFPATMTQRQSPLHPLRKLFKPSLQQSLIIWGFKAGLLPNSHLEQSMFGSPLEKKHYRRRLLQNQVLNRLDWAVGLRAVVQLRDLGVYVHYRTVVKALQMQFVVMFGRGRSNKKENRVMERGNTIPYARYVQEVNKIWGSRLLTEPQLFDKAMVHEHLWHPRQRRKINRRASVSLAEILGPNWLERSNEREEKSEGKETEKHDATAFETLQKHFMAQAKVTSPDFKSTFGTGLGEPGGLGIKARRRAEIKRWRRATRQLLAQAKNAT